MIIVVAGVGVGSGKSYVVTEKLVIPHLIKGGVIHYSYHYQPKREGLIAEMRRRGYDIDDSWLAERLVELSMEANERNIHELTPIGTPENPVAILIDECHEWFFTKDTGDKTKRQFFAWLTQSRHDDTDVWFVSQHADNIDVSIRRLASFVWVVRNLEFSTNVIIRALFKNNFRLTPLEGETLKYQGGGIFIKKAWKTIGACYETKARRGAHQRAGTQVALPQIERKKKSMWKIVLAVGCVIFAAVFGVWKVLPILKNGPVSKPVSVVQAEKNTQEKKGTVEQGSRSKIFGVDIASSQQADTEYYTGCTQGVCISTSKRVYWIGDLTQDGKVLAVAPFYMKTTGREFFFQGRPSLLQPLPVTRAAAESKPSPAPAEIAASVPRKWTHEESAVVEANSEIDAELRRKVGRRAHK